MKLRNILLGIGLLAAVGFFGWKILPSGEPDASVEKRKVLRSRQIREIGKDKSNRRQVKIASGGEAIRRSAKKGDSEWNPFGASKPSFDFDEEIEAELSDEMKSIITEISVALSSPDTDKKAVYRAVQRLLAAMAGDSAASSSGHRMASLGGGRRGIGAGGGGADAVPTVVKERALDALKWIGAEAMAETIPFIADADPQVAAVAKEVLMDQLMDFDASESDMVAAIKQLVQVDLESGYYEDIMSSVSMFKTANKVDVALTVVDSGTDGALNALNQNLDFIFDESAYESIKTREDIVRYGQEHGKDDFDFDFK